ncbi:hypothetical protein WJX73_009565 [Symbiochloris irregularis]|uniref:Uncharacterized protein n=1 Tax=Symbiochloris irregularis TaxID=706552 RepID=A0AAW1NTD6_9CHLO
MRSAGRLASRLLGLRRTLQIESLTAPGPYSTAPAASLATQERLWAPCCSHAPSCSFRTSTPGNKQPPHPSQVPVDQEHVNIGNENDKEIIRASAKGTHEALYDVVKLHGEEFTETNVATTFNQLAKIAEQKGDDGKAAIQKDPTFHTLIDMVVMGRRRYDVKQLALILRSLAELGFDNDMVFDRMSQHIMDKLPKADPKALVDLATGLAVMGHSPSIVLFEAIQKQALQQKGDLSKAEKEELVKAFSKLGYKDMAEKLK